MTLDLEAFMAELLDEAQAVVDTQTAPTTYNLINTVTGLAAALPKYAAAALIGLDLETTGLDPHTDTVRIIQLAREGHPVDVVDVQAVPTCWEALRPVLESHTIVAHNMDFEYRWLLGHGITIEKPFCTMLASQILAGGGDWGCSLREVAIRYLGRELDKTSQVSGWSGELTEAQLEYAALDAAIMLPLHTAICKELDKRPSGDADVPSFWPIFNLEMGCQPALSTIKYNGIGFDVAKTEDAAREYREQADAALEALKPYLNGFKPFSHKNVQPLMEAAIGTRLPDMQADTLYPHLHVPMVKAYADFKKLDKLATLYEKGGLAHVNPTTGRVHPDYRQIGAWTGRMSAAHPNFQQTPRDPVARSCYVPKPGNVMIKVDYAAIESRLAALESGDERMLAMFRSGQDPHITTASYVTGKAPDQITKGDRQLSKALNFGLTYGMGHALFRVYAQTTYNVPMTELQAKKLREKYFKVYPDLRAWQQRQGVGTGDVFTRAGRVSFNVEQYTRRLNAPIQGLGVDGLKLALAHLHQDRHSQPEALLVGCVHDEIIAECPREQGPEVKAWLEHHMTEAMSIVVDHKVPIKAEGGIYTDWSGQEEVQYA